MMKTIDVQQVSKSFRVGGQDVHAVADASLQLEAGEFLAIRGPSGCGKSTLLLMLGGLLSPDAGRVQVAGEDVYAMSVGQRGAFRAKHIGFVFQRFHLVPYLSVLDNVLAPTLALDLPDARKRAAQLLEQFGMTHRLTHVPAQLSTGERQRVALARALLAQPAVILADEPTGNLDAENSALVLNALTDCAKRGITVVLVTHDQEATAAAGRVLTMRHGRIESPVAS